MKNRIKTAVRADPTLQALFSVWAAAAEVLAAGVVLIETLVVELVVLEVRVTSWPAEQVGRSTAPGGSENMEQVRCTVPTYASFDLTIIEFDPLAPLELLNAADCNEYVPPVF